MDKFYKKYTLMLAISIALGIILVGGSLTYAYFVVTITGTESASVIDVHSTSSITLSITPNSGTLSLYKIYPITDSEAEGANYYVFTVTNPTNKTLNYNVYLEVLNASNANTLPASEVKIEVSTCTGTTSQTCTKKSGYPVLLSSLPANPNDVANVDATGYLISSGTNFAPNDSQTYGVKLWQSIDGVSQGRSFNVAVTAVSSTL